ncbi:hypothetical protein SDC9_50050 [bioreactor metagenome]|uniref:Uncharacterized protein n=1 Tax=bioreactor metagenome TaxID=1076179 RepID=A0A644WN07_9ZZZZ
MGGTDIDTMAAIDAAILHDHRRAVLDLNRLHRTAPDTLITVPAFSQFGIDGINHAFPPLLCSSVLTSSRTLAVSSPL